MTTPNDGGPAFPMEGEVYGKPDDPRWARGMSLRDYFAAKAMAAMVASFRVVNHRDPLIDDDVTTMEPHRDRILDRNGVSGEYDGATEIADDAYVIADAMLAAGDEKEGK